MKKIALFLAAGAMSLAFGTVNSSAQGMIEVKIQVDPDEASTIAPNKDGKEKRDIFSTIPPPWTSTRKA